MDERLRVGRFAFNFGVTLLLGISMISIMMSGCGGQGQSGSDVTSGADSPRTGSATLVWEAPTTNLNGTQLIDLAGYKIYYGTTSGNYDETIDVGAASCQANGPTTECTSTIDDLDSDTYYFAVTAYDTSGNESSFSSEGSKTIP